MQQVKNSLSTHLGNELIRIGIVKEIVIGINFVINDIEILFFCQQVKLM